MPRVTAGCRQVVEIFGRGQFDRLHGQLCRGATDNDGEVIGRTGRGAQRPHLLINESGKAFRIQQRLGFLIQEALVCRATTLRHEQELVGITLIRIKLDLRRQVCAGIGFGKHVDWRDLTVTQVILGIAFHHTTGDGFLIIEAGPDALAFLAHDNGRTGILTHRQYTGGGNIRVLEQVEGHELVIRAGLRVLENIAQAFQMCRSQQVRDIVKSFTRQQGDRFRINLQYLAAVEIYFPDMIRGQLAVRGRVLAEWKHRLM